MDFFISLCVFGGAAGYGRFFLARTRAGFLPELAVGLWFLAHGVYVLGLIGDLSRGWLWLLLGSGLVFLCTGLKRYCPVVSAYRPVSVLEGLLAAAIVGLVGLALLGALAPEIARDSLLYHLALPKLYVEHGRWLKFSQNIYGSYPFMVEALYTLVLGVGGKSPALIHFGFGLLCLVATYELAGRLAVRRGIALLCCLGLVSAPTFWLEMTWSYVDLANTFYWLLSMIAFWGWQEQRQKKWLILLGFFVGAACCTKYSSLFLLMVMPLALLLTLKRQKQVSPGVVVATVLLPMIVALLAFSPWLIKNSLWTGNPLFPFFLSIFPNHSPGWDGRRAALNSIMLSQFGGPDKSLVDYLVAPFRVFWAAEPDRPYLYDGRLGPFFLLAWAGLFTVKKIPSRVGDLFGLVGLYLVYWSFSSQQARFLLVILPFLVVLIGFGLEGGWRSWEMAEAGRSTSNRLARGATLLLLFLMLAGISFNLYFTLKIFGQGDYLASATGRISEEEYLAKRLDYYEIYQYINRELPVEASLFLVMTGNQGYYLNRKYFSDAAFESHTFTKILTRADSGPGVAAECRRLGFTHLLIRPDFFLRERGATLSDPVLARFRSFITEQPLVRQAGPYLLLDLRVTPSQSRWR